MGVPGLNKFLVNRASSKAVRPIMLRELKGLRVGIDTSLYLHRAVSTLGVATGLYQLLGTMRASGVEPVFVYDGRYPQQKVQTVQKRGERRDAALLKLADLRRSGLEDSVEAKLLERQAARVKPSDRDLAQRLITAAGCESWQAAGEADSLLVSLCMQGEVHAVMTDDMDIIAAGCPRVIRKVSLLKGTGILYDTDRLAKEIGLDKLLWPEWAALAGCDYGEGFGVEYAFKLTQGHTSSLTTKQTEAKDLLNEWRRGKDCLGWVQPANGGDLHTLTALLRGDGLVFAPHCSVASLLNGK